jgi:acyl carrier protein
MSLVRVKKTDVSAILIIALAIVEDSGKLSAEYLPTNLGTIENSLAIDSTDIVDIIG